MCHQWDSKRLQKYISVTHHLSWQLLVRVLLLSHYPHVIAIVYFLCVVAVATHGLLSVCCYGVVSYVLLLWQLMVYFLYVDMVYFLCVVAVATHGLLSVRVAASWYTVYVTKKNWYIFCMCVVITT